MYYCRQGITEVSCRPRNTVNVQATQRPRSLQANFEQQNGLLPGVSRTFALTIPQLPDPLAGVVTNAYLLCRIADTIEDDTNLSHQQKADFHRRFVMVVEGRESPSPFAAELAPLLSDQVLPAERRLVEQTAAVIAVTHGLQEVERDALSRCVRIMCSGMPEFQRNKTLSGLRNIPELARYCYFVAGVVGEMLTELFCIHSPAIAARRSRLAPLAVSFGQGLQMTNILKDIWTDRRAGSCWLPRSVFAGNINLQELESASNSPAFKAGLEELIGIAHRHLRYALDYACEIPVAEVGVRRFCFWAIGLAVLTLRKVHRQAPDIVAGRVKVSRRTVKATIASTNLFVANNRLSRLLFKLASIGVPLAAEGEVAPEVGPLMAADSLGSSNN